MNERTNNKEVLYDVMEIKSLNCIEGFDPRKFMRVLRSEGQSTKYYLDVAFRKLWFRLKYPEGKISKSIIKLTEQFAVTEAKVYMNRNDQDNAYLANAFAQRYLSTDTDYGNRFIECAETAATGRALADAGFGLQFADMEEEFDPSMVDAGIDVPLNQWIEENTGTLQGAVIQEVVQELQTSTEMISMSQNTGSSAVPINTGVPPVMQTQAEMGHAPQSIGQNPATNITNPIQAPANSVATISKDMPVEQIYAMLNRDMAAAVVISSGFNKGKTLGQLAVEKPAGLNWYVNEYKGPDNLLRAASKYLLDAAIQKAS